MQNFQLRAVAARGWQQALAILLAGALAAGCGNGTADEAGKGDSEEQTPIPVEVRPVERGDVLAVYSGTAPLEAEAEARVVAKVGGEILAIKVEEGDLVKAGQILAVLDDQRLRLEVERARANLAKLQLEYDRDVKLFSRGLVTQEAFESRKHEIEALKASLGIAELELSYTQIRAPIDGVIAERAIKVGNTITANTTVFRIADLDPLIAYLHVPEREFNKLVPGQQADIRIDALGKTAFSGVIARISPVVDPATGTFKVTIEADDPQRRLKPGMFARFNVVYDVHEQAVLIPRAAIIDDQAERSVFIVEEGVAKRRVITTGLANGSQIEVLEGLDGSERIVTIGQTGLRDGGRVEVVESSSTSSTRVAANAARG